MLYDTRTIIYNTLYYALFYIDYVLYHIIEHFVLFSFGGGCFYLINSGVENVYFTEKNVLVPDKNYKLNNRTIILWVK